MSHTPPYCLASFSSDTLQGYDCKKMQDETEGTVRTHSSRASKQAPVQNRSATTPTPFSSRPNLDPIKRLVRKIFWGSRKALSYGACFEHTSTGSHALKKLVLEKFHLATRGRFGQEKFRLW